MKFSKIFNEKNKKLTNHEKIKIITDWLNKNGRGPLSEKIELIVNKINKKMP
ncbi:hypothetical protein ACFL23_01660 [Patescibacteria group bacterium]